MPELLGSIQPTALIPAPIPAAQYLRMSTDHQKYSTQNQEDAIAEYASRRGYAVVRTYADGGRSGLLFKNRTALKELIAHVRSGQADYNTILVYDVSRWGRFQDVALTTSSSAGKRAFKSSTVLSSLKTMAV
jgi:DNA invertase Pin-like site-specific DNA recombinase